MYVEHVKTDIWVFVIFGSIAFFYLRSARTDILLALIIASIWALVAYMFLAEKSKVIEKSEKSAHASILDIEERAKMGHKEIISDVVEVTRIPRQGLKYIGKNKTFVDIINDLKFVKIFDKSRYQDIIVHMDKLQKTYSYILSKRIKAREHVPIFVDLADAVKELLYSLYLVVPPKLRHTYGIHPYNVLRGNIETFHKTIDKMTRVLYNFNKGEMKAPYFAFMLPSAYDAPRQVIREHTLP